MPGIYSFEQLEDDNAMNCKAFVKDFKLENTLSVKNMVLVCEGDNTKKYSTVGHILDIFFKFSIKTKLFNIRI
jgi:hypothetical protein